MLEPSGNRRGGGLDRSPAVLPVDLGAAVRVTDAYATRAVTIDPAVGGSPTSGFGWRVSVAAKGVVQLTPAVGRGARPDRAGRASGG